MKKISVIITAAILAATLASCANYSTVRLESENTVDVIVGGTKEFTVGSVNAASSSDTVKREDHSVSYGKVKMKTVTYSPASYLNDSGSLESYDNVRRSPIITFDIPEQWGSSGSGEYMRFDAETSYYIRTFGITNVLEVKADAVMDRYIAALYGIEIPDDADVTSGKTYTGYDFISFSNAVRVTDSYKMDAFIRVAPETVIHATFNLPYDQAILAERIVHSVKFTGPADTEAYPEALRGYLEYLVSYIHEPVTEGADLSESNLLYLTFLTAFSHHESLDGAELTEDGSALKISGALAEDICEAITGKAYDLTSYHKYFENNADSYSAENDTYMFALERDYWEGDHYYVDHEVPLKITETEKGYTVQAQTYYCPGGVGGEYVDGSSMEFEFETVDVQGVELYRIVSIREVV